MKEYIVSALKYRPSNFSTVIGQNSIVRTLKNSIKKKHIGHAYLFCGPRGVGKTTCARIFAKTINCQNLTEDQEACQECESCKAFNSGRSYNIHELDAASNNSVDDIRSLIDKVRIPPQIGKYSIFIIDEVHMLSSAAFNSFLKTLEEPPEHAIFILATTEKHKIIATILSRCQIYDFNRIKVRDIEKHLRSVADKETVDVENDALNIIALKADGAMRDALTIFDQVVSFSTDKITYQTIVENLNVLDYNYLFDLTKYFIENDFNQVLLTLNEISDKGFNLHDLIINLAEHFRNLIVVKAKTTIKLLETGESIKKKYLQQTEEASLRFLYSALNVLSETDVHFKASKNNKLFVEIAMLKLCQLTELPKVEVANNKQETKVEKQKTIEEKIKEKSEEEKRKIKQELDSQKGLSLKTTMSNIKTTTEVKNNKLEVEKQKPVKNEIERKIENFKEINPEFSNFKKELDLKH